MRRIDLSPEGEKVMDLPRIDAITEVGTAVVIGFHAECRVFLSRAEEAQTIVFLRCSTGAVQRIYEFD